MSAFGDKADTSIAGSRADPRRPERASNLFFHIVLGHSIIFFHRILGHGILRHRVLLHRILGHTVFGHRFIFAHVVLGRGLGESGRRAGELNYAPSWLRLLCLQYGRSPTGLKFIRISIYKMGSQVELIIASPQAHLQAH